jgi:hypothetical protein
VFTARWPACLGRTSGSAFRVSLRTADYKIAVIRAARIASWMLSVKAAEDPRSALLALWPRLQSLAAEPVRDETDYVERIAFQYAAFEVQALVRFSGVKPDAVAACRLLHGGVDRNSLGLSSEGCEPGRLLHGGVDRNQQAIKIVVEAARRLLHGGVDRNVSVSVKSTILSRERYASDPQSP